MRQNKYSIHIMIKIILILSLLEFIAQILLKYAINNTNYVIFGVLAYALVGYVYYVGLKNNKFGTMSMAWHIAMTIGTIFVGYIVFGEKYSNREKIGFILGVISLFLLQDNHH